MLDKIKAFFDTEIQSDAQGEMGEHELRLASAALLIEVATIDEKFDDKEFATLRKILMDQYHLSAEECDELTRLARQEFDEATSMYQFTQLINDNCSQQDKFNLVKSMWMIAYADGDLDKYEEYIIRKTSDLLHLAHNDFIRAKHAARDIYR